jgi:phosphatidylserine decarboxylase
MSDVIGSLVGFLKTIRIHPAGWPFVGMFFIATLLLFLISSFWGSIALLLSLWCAYFFRNPDRVISQRQGGVVSPADGLLVSIDEAASPPKELQGYEKGTWKRLSIFLNVFDVHVNRIPFGGRVLMRVYHPGQFLNASLDKASDLNERNSLVLESPEGIRLIVVQIAGLIARRILCEVSLGDDVSLGDPYGIIRFGSRVDLYVPSEAEILVSKGQRMVGGETVLAVMPN